MSRVRILLSTYNGAKYLGALLDSLQGQTYDDWTLLARDDGSTDSTAEILQQYRERDSRVLFHDGIRENLGPIQSFGVLTGASLDQDYLFFCDQDDVWLPGKVERVVSRMEILEAEAGSDVPLALHHDLEVMSRDGHRIHPSFRKKAGFRIMVPGLERLLTQNVATGCAMAFNRSLAHLANPIPSPALMHDWWVALLARSTGEFHFLDETLIRYRQHEENTSGALSELGLLRKARLQKLNLSHFDTLTQDRFAQSMALEKRLAERGHTCESMTRLHHSIRNGRWAAIRHMMRHRMAPQGFARTQLFRTLFFKNYREIRRIVENCGAQESEESSRFFRP